MKPVPPTARPAEPRLTLLDRAIGLFSPSTSLARMRSRFVIELAEGGYKGGRRDRRPHRNWRPPTESANAATLADLPYLRSRSHDLARNMPIATGALATVTTGVVGDGLRLNANVDGEFLGLTPDQTRALNRAAEREFALMSRSIDFTRCQSHDEQTATAFCSALEAGDIFAVKRFRKDAGDVYGLKIQLIEAERVSNENNRADNEIFAGGVEHDPTGVPVAYWMSDVHPGALGRKPIKWKRVLIRTAAGEQQVLHLFDRLRPDQARGVPYLAPVIDTIKQLGDYTDAEVRAAVLGAFVAWFVTRTEVDATEGPVLGSKSADDGVQDTTKELALPEGGAIVDLQPGEGVNQPTPGRPNQAFDPFVTSVLRQVGVALELPFELLVKHFTASYSASRAALELAWQFFRRRRAWLVRRYSQPIYEWMWDEAVARGRLVAPGYFRDPAIRAAYTRASWLGQPRASIDPRREADADRIDVETGFKSRALVIAQRVGADPDAIHAQLVEEERRRRDDGLGEAKSPAAALPAVAAPAAGDDEDEDEEDDK